MNVSLQYTTSDCVVRVQHSLLSLKVRVQKDSAWKRYRGTMSVFKQTQKFLSFEPSANTVIFFQLLNDDRSPYSKSSKT